MLGQEQQSKLAVYQLLRRLNGIGSYAQATQDLFVLSMLGTETPGVYLEVGAGHPFDSNNTALLEESFGWSGLSIEIDRDLAAEFERRRRNRVICDDALTHDFLMTCVGLAHMGRVDYLSLDIDPSDVSCRALHRLPHDQVRFSVITFEHDRYASGDACMHASRGLLSELGYELVVANVSVFGRDFEDWWVDPDTVGEFERRLFRRSGSEFWQLWLDHPFTPSG